MNYVSLANVMIN